MIYNLRRGRINVRLCGISPHFPKCFVVNNRPRRVSGTDESSDDIVRLLCIQTPEHPLLRLLDFHASFGILRNKSLLVGVLLSLQGVVDPRMRSPVVHPERVSVVSAGRLILPCSLFGSFSRQIVHSYVRSTTQINGWKIGDRVVRLREPTSSTSSSCSVVARAGPASRASLDSR